MIVYDIKLQIAIDKLDKIMIKILKSVGIDSSASKQAKIAQKWKVKFLPGVPFKIEFSRRKAFSPDIYITTQQWFFLPGIFAN